MQKVTSLGGMSYIEEDLFLGSYYAARNRELLIGHNISAIVNVSDDIPNFFEGSGEVEEEETNQLKKGKGKEEGSSSSSHSFLYFNCAIEDRKEVNIFEHFERTTSWIEERRQEGRGVLIHCRGGISRSPTILLAYLIRFKDLSLSDAITKVLKQRRIEPNEGFCQQLIRWEIKQRGKPSVKTQSSFSSNESKRFNKPKRGGKGR